jgi:hypothetical protein
MPMVPILNYPDIDGARYSRTSVDLSVVATRSAGNGLVAPVGPGLRIEGWTSMSFQRKLTPGKGWSHRAKPQTRTRGKFEPSMELGMYMEDYILLERYLALTGATAAKGPFEQAFTLTATLYEAALLTTVWQGVGCRIEQDSAPIEGNSDEEIEVKLTLNVMDVLRDGQSAVYENTPFGQAGAIVTLTA